MEELTRRKRLDHAIVAARSVRDVRRNGVRMVEIPYRDTDQSVVSVRYRDGASFRWRGGDKVRLYGLERLAAIRETGWVLLVEGESDTWTADAFGIPALGIPGKATWRPEWRPHLEGLDVVLWQEPDAADLTARLGRDLPDARIIVAPEGTKDISDAHIGGRDVAALVNELRASAPTAADLVARQRADAAAAALPEIELRAAPVLACPDPLDLVESTIRAGGYGGDVRPVLVVYLAATTRLLGTRPGATPTHVLLVGPPSAGESYTLTAALALLPPEATHNAASHGGRIRWTWWTRWNAVGLSDHAPALPVTARHGAQCSGGSDEPGPDYRVARDAGAPARRLDRRQPTLCIERPGPRPAIR